MKLLLDEMISAAVAQQLRARGYDVRAVTEDSALRGMPDDELFGYAQEDGRAVVTCNHSDFLEIDGRWRSRGSSHLGVVIVSPKRFPHGRGSLGSLVVSLARLLDDGPPYESFVGWLD